MKSAQYEGVGYFENEWRNPPKPFNPQFDPSAADRFTKVTASMENDEYYANRSRAECKEEWALRYDALKNAGK